MIKRGWSLIDFSAKIIKHKKPIVITVVILALISTIAQFAVSVNYNMVDYLPEDAPSMQAMDLMEDEFDEPIPNARVMVRDVSITEALAYKEKLEAIDVNQQRVNATENESIKKILAHHRDEEKEHASMILEWIRRNDMAFAKELKDYLFT